MFDNMKKGSLIDMEYKEHKMEVHTQGHFIKECIMEKGDMREMK